MWEGAVGRRLLQEKFEISPQQATLDLTGYLDLAPKNMAYDPRQRTYVARSTFKPMLLKGEASEYLVHLEMLHQGYREPDEIWPARIPSFDAVTLAARKTDPETLKTVLRAIRDKQCVEAMYVSLSSSSDTVRALYPHAIASDGHRWHMRAFDADKERYSDFVLSRIEKIKLGARSKADFPKDEKWSSFVDLKLQPDPSLSERQKRQLEIEYDMNDGHALIKVRQAMLFYYLRFYGFDPRPTEDGKIRNKSSFALNIQNIEEVEECIGRRN
jgi:predicted DNA-binding transcriptional regulator YafY